MGFEKHGRPRQGPYSYRIAICKWFDFGKTKYLSGGFASYYSEEFVGFVPTYTVAIMLKFVGKAFNYAWTMVSPSAGTEPYFDESDDDDNEQELTNLREEKDIFGTITEVNQAERFGVIDGTTFFSFDKLFGSKHPKVGEKVAAKISRLRPEHSFVAECVNVIDELWEVEDVQEEKKQSNPSKSLSVENSKENHIVSIVREVKLNGAVKMEDFLEFNFKDTQCKFVPCIGDVLLLHVLEDIDNENEKKVLGFEAIRADQVEGEITMCKQDGGVINNEVWFSYSACQNFQPKRGDKVIAQTVETKRGKFMWRATRVVHQNPAKNTFNKVAAPIVPKFSSPTQNSFIAELLKDKNDVFVTNNLSFQTMELLQEKYITVWITNKGQADQKLISCRFKNSVDKTCQFIVSKAVLYSVCRNQTRKESPSQDEKQLSTLVIPPGQKAYVNLICKSTTIGRSRYLLFIEFEKFSIGRYVEVEVSCDLEKKLLPSVPYRRTSRGSDALKQKQVLDNYDNSFIICGEMPFKPPSNVPVKLLSYPIPRMLWDPILNENEDEIFKLLPSLPEGVCFENYSDRFSALLHLEEIQMTLDMRRYDIKDVCLSRTGDFLKLSVPGLAEGRPSLLVGDRVYLTSPEDYDVSPTFEGFIHELLRTDVLVKFNPVFQNSYGGESFNVAFQFSRTSLRRCHQAIQQISQIGAETIFPTKSMPKLPVISVTVETEKSLTPSKNEIMNALITANSPKGKLNSSRITLKWFNTLLNERQQTAVKRIVENQSRPFPYIIFGPPGTGKTITLVEAALQIFHLIKTSRVLIVTPSNSAADLIVERLHESGKIGTPDMVRVNSFSRTRNGENISEKVLPYCKTTSLDVLESVAYHRIIISTCSSIGCFYTLGLNTKHFTHAIIDEAGQATEPESMVAIGLVARGGGQVILAGDHMQLGPVLRSVYSSNCGLQLSMLERLMERQPYQRDEKKFSDHGNFDPLLVTKLVKNYRSHPSILKVYSTLFYHNELEPLANKSVVNVFEGWNLLPNPKFPVIFDGVRGENFREDSSPSWFNPAEVVQVTRYMKELYDYGIAPEDIGIITPYKKQAEKIRMLMGCLELEPCKVGSVEEFQGQEYLVIVVSTVRTCPDLLEYDVTHNLGFLRNHKRFNVAVSRAIALLIVIGDPFLLSKDSHWGVFLEYCLKNKAYKGSEYSGF